MSVLSPLAQRLARAMQPDLWARLDAAEDKPLIVADLRMVEQTTAAVLAIMPILHEHGFDRDRTNTTLGEALDLAQTEVTNALDLLQEFAGDARGDLTNLIERLGELASDIEEKRDEIACTECNEYSADGEGFDGLCGDCADRSSDDNGEAIDLDDIDDKIVDSVHPHLSYASYYVSSAEQWRGLVVENGKLAKTTRNLYDSSDEALAAAARLYASGSDDGPFPDTDEIEVDATQPNRSYGALFIDESDRFRGTVLVSGEQIATTDLLYLTPAAARAAAAELATSA